MHGPWRENLIVVVCWVSGMFLFVRHLVPNNTTLVCDRHIYEWTRFSLRRFLVGTISEAIRLYAYYNQALIKYYLIHAESIFVY